MNENRDLNYLLLCCEYFIVRSGEFTDMGRDGQASVSA